MFSARIRREVRRQAPGLDRAFSLGLLAFLIVLAVASAMALSDGPTVCSPREAGLSPLPAESLACGRRP